MKRKHLIKTIISTLVSLFVVILIAVGGILYFGLFEQISNAIVGMYYVHKGDKAYRNNKLPKAIQYYQKGLNAYPKHFEAWTNLGNLYVKFEDFYDAKEAYENAIKEKPSYTMARMNYGIIATEKLGNFEEAINQFKSIIETKNKIWFIPFIFNNKKSTKINKGLAYYNMGVAYRLKSFYESENEDLAREDLKKAIEAYEEALKILPKDYNTLFNLGFAYQVSGNSKKAAIYYCKAIDIEPMNYEAHYNLAILLRHLKMYKEAFSEIEKATILASEGNINSNAKSYVFDILNDMSMVLISNDEYKYLLENQPTTELTYVGGKMVATEDLDKAILKNLKKCEAQDYINEDN